MKIHFLNVGNGDCTLIELPDNNIMIIDICNARLKAKEAREGFENPLSYLATLNSSNSIMRYIQTHPDMDHMDGLADLTQKYTISNFWDTANTKQKPEDFSQGFREEDWDTYQELRKAGAKNFVRGDIITSGKPEYKIHVISPSTDMVNEGNKNEDWNFLSYVIILEYKNFFFAFAGDTSDSVWENIYTYVVKNNSIKELLSKVNIFNAPHHGRTTSYCGKEMLDLMKPEKIVISKGSVPGDQSAYPSYYNYFGDAKNLYLTSKGTVIVNLDEQKLTCTIGYK